MRTIRLALVAAALLLPGVASATDAAFDQDLPALLAADANDYVEAIETELARLGLSSRNPRGVLNRPAIRDITAFCLDAGIYDTCKLGILTPETATAIEAAFRAMAAPAPVQPSASVTQHRSSTPAAHADEPEAPESEPAPEPAAAEAAPASEPEPVAEPEPTAEPEPAATALDVTVVLACEGVGEEFPAFERRYAAELSDDGLTVALKEESEEGFERWNTTVSAEGGFDITGEYIELGGLKELSFTATREGDGVSGTGMRGPRNCTFETGPAE